MKIRSLLLAVAFSFTTIGLSFAGPKTYQVTGPVLALTDSTVTVQNTAGEKWELGRDASTKITGELKVGAKVTIQYTMSATTVDVKADDGKGGKKKSK